MFVCENHKPEELLKNIFAVWGGMINYHCTINVLA